MLVIAIRFPAGGRYHATAWGSHANEGVPEWPPSPWRLLRALIATARWKDGLATCAESPRLRQLIEALAASPPPRYVLPPAAAAHTRHFMPDNSPTHKEDGQLKFGPQRGKIFDTFVQPECEKDLVILWDAPLDASSREYLAALLAKLNYFGRSESLAEAELLPLHEKPASLVNAYPLAPGEPLDNEQQTFKLLAPQPPADYAAWQGARAPAPSTKLTTKERKAQPPADLFAALHLDTEDWRGAGWSQPPGSRWVEYVRPATPFKLAAPPARHARRAQAGPRPTVARFEIQTPVRESITKALSLGERLHVALCSRSDASPVFSGLQNGEPISGHDHTFYLPECDDRGMLTRVTVYARMGFDDDAVEALRSLRETWSRHSPGLKLLLLGLGQANEFRDVISLSTATEWFSLTPFVPVRHIQRSRTGKPRVDAETGLIRGEPTHDLRRLIVQNGLPAPLEIKPLDVLSLDGRRIRWANFQRERRHGDGTGIITHSGYGFHLRFPEPVTGPLAFGYGAHFGLGLFVPA